MAFIPKKTKEKEIPRDDEIKYLSIKYSYPTWLVSYLLKDYKFVNFVFGTHNIHRLPYILKEAFNSKKQEIEVYSKEGNIVEGMPVKRTNKYKAYVNIMYGCDKFCTYCIVPYTRGKQRSRNKDDIIEEVLKLKEDGYQEVTLLGQNVNAYGKDFSYDYNLENLLEDVSKTNIPRVRFMTSHPKDASKKLFDTMASCDKVCKSIHLPVQAGSDRVLQMMNRKYTSAHYLDLVDYARSVMPDITITTDIIVGFPGETEENFMETYNLLAELRPAFLHIFPFSERPGTPAVDMPDKVPSSVSTQRVKQLEELCQKLHYEFCSSMVGKEADVLFESTMRGGMMYGYTGNYVRVKARYRRDLINRISRVRLTSVDPDCSSLAEILE